MEGISIPLRLEDKFGNAIQPSGKVLVSLPIAANKEVENVFYVTAANQLDALAFQQKGQIVEFMSDHFSVYAVVYKASQNHLAISQDDGSENKSPLNLLFQPYLIVNEICQEIKKVSSRIQGRKVTNLPS